MGAQPAVCLALVRCFGCSSASCPLCPGPTSPCAPHCLNQHPCTVSLFGAVSSLLFWSWSSSLTPLAAQWTARRCVWGALPCGTPSWTTGQPSYGLRVVRADQRQWGQVMLLHCARERDRVASRNSTMQMVESCVTCVAWMSVEPKRPTMSLHEACAGRGGNCTFRHPHVLAWILDENLK